MTVKQLNVNIDEQVKNDYKDLIQNKYDRVRNVYASQIENALKMYLAVNGCSEYVDDPDVQELLEAAKKTPCTHTQQSHEPKNETNDLEERFKKMEAELAEVKEQLAGHESTQNQRKIGKEQRRYRDHSIDGLVSSFYDEYGDDQQVSYTDLSKLVMKTHGVLDKRSIHNRVQYLLAEGCIEPFAPNVYNIMR